MAKTAWRCSQCGTVNEPGTHACSECGKWASLFDLQDSTVDEAELEVAEDEVFEVEAYEPEVYETGPFEPDVFGEEKGEEKEEAAERRGRFPRWVVTAIWVIGILVWIIVNALADRG